MAQSFKETAHLKTDLEKYHANFDAIDWTKNKEDKTDAKTEEYDECFIGEIEILHFENTRDALSRQSIRFDEPALLEMSPILIKEFLLKKKFDLEIEGAAIIKSFDYLSSWEDYYLELSEWLSNGQIPNEEPTHPDTVCYSTEYLRNL